MATADMSLKSLVPGTCVIITDIMTSVRKLCEVTESGNTYIDLSDDPCPFPIYNVMQPVAVGNPVSWAAEATERGAGKEFVAIEARMIDASVDRMTRLRALYWCSETGTYDYDKALVAGRAATDEVAKSRQYMDSFIRRAAA